MVKCKSEGQHGRACQSFFAPDLLPDHRASLGIILELSAQQSSVRADLKHDARSCCWDLARHVRAVLQNVGAPIKVLLHDWVPDSALLMPEVAIVL
jgi:hypothetical protein